MTKPTIKLVRYRIPLREQTGRGAWDSIRALLFSLYISADGEEDLSARGMKNITEAKITELMQVNSHVEKPHETIPGLVVGQLGGPIYELVQLITQVLNETGTVGFCSRYITATHFNQAASLHRRGTRLLVPSWLRP